jgi:deoxyribonuclease V
MRIRELHRWDLTPAEARSVQQELAGRVRLRPLPERARLVAGADMAVDRQGGRFFAVVTVLAMPGLETLEKVWASAPAAFPYVPGLLTFREGPALVAAFRKLRRRPDAVIFDGQGLAHPRRMGLACHMGLWLGLPTVGCAKSRLIGKYEEPGEAKGCSAPLLDGEEQVGLVLRTRTGVKPVFVSPGHLANAATSSRLVLRCCGRYRLPEPTRRAHVAVGRVKREQLGMHS